MNDSSANSANNAGPARPSCGRLVPSAMKARVVLVMAHQTRAKARTTENV